MRRPQYSHTRNITNGEIKWTTKNMIILAAIALIIMYSALLYKVHTFLGRMDSQEPLIVLPNIVGGNTELPTYLQPRPISPHVEPLEPTQQRDDNPEIDSIVDRSNQYKFEGKWNESLFLLDQGLLKYPRSDKLNTFKGGWYFDKGDFAQAMTYYQKAADINPSETIYLMNVALCLNNLNRPLEAAVIYQKVYSRRKDVWILLSLAETLWKYNNWTNHAYYLNEIIMQTRQQIDSGQHVSINTFMALHYAFTAKDILGIASSASNGTYRDTQQRTKNEGFNLNMPKRPPKPAGSKIVVGYVSYDFHLHAVGVQVMNMYKYHDKSKFEIIAYNANDGSKADNNDWVAQKIKAGVSQWVDIGHMSPAVAAQRIYDDEVDILIDMGLFTAYARMDIFTLRPAPIQCAWLGLASTTGGVWMDYVIGDPVASPLQFAYAYTEKIAMMPHSYHIFDHRQTYPELLPAFPRSQHGLPEDKFIFCNPANNIRQNPELFDHWLSILNKVPNSVLVMKFFEEISAENLRNYARERGLVVNGNVNENRLFFQPGSDKHIQMKAMCDVYLDIHYYNGHSTSGDMLYAGVPMVTFPAETMAGRAAASFVTSASTPEVAREQIATSWEDYEAKAVRLATDKALYKKVRNSVENSRHTGPLFDTPRFVRNMERLFKLMYDRKQKGLGPDHLLVEGDTS